MKILVTGINGQVGHALMRELTEHELIGLTRKECDLTNLDQIRQVIDQHQPDLIINPAAYTNVDQAEDEPDLAFQINRDAPKIMAEKAREYDIPFIHFSTDYVFNGEKEGPYDENDTPLPLGIYGLSKLSGEEAIQGIGGKFFIFRTSWVYSILENNFYYKIRLKCKEKKELSVVCDQIGVPTSNLFISYQLKKILKKLNIDKAGLYHIVPNNYCSWFDFAKIIITKTNSHFDLDNLIKINSSELNVKVNRPQNSVLCNDKIKLAFNLKFSSWQEEFDKVIKCSK